MIIKFEDAEWKLDLDDVDVNQARFVKRNTGMTLLDLEEALERVDPDAMAVLYWLMKNQSGVTVDLNKVNFKIVAFGKAINAAQIAEAEALAANPTSADAPSEPAPAT